MHAFNNVFVSSDATSAPQQDVGEQINTSKNHTPSSLAEQANGAGRAPQRTDGFSGFRQKQAHKALYFLPVVAITLLLLNMFLCRLKKGKNVRAGDRVRRLARGEDGKEGEEKAGSRAPEMCGLLEKAVSSSQEEERGGARATPPHGEEEKPRKRKRKTKWLEGAAEQTKKVKPESPSSPTGSSAEEEEDLLGLLEETVMAAIDTAGTKVEDWGDEFEEELLLGPLPEASPRVPPDSDQRGEAGLASEEQNVQLLFQAAEEPQGGQETAAGRDPFLSDHTYAQTPLERHPRKAEQEQLDDEAIPSTSGTFELERSPAAAPLPQLMHLPDHPFYRLPRGAPGAQLRLFNGNAAFSMTGEPKHLGAVLDSMRALFLKEELSEVEMASLMSHATLLLRFAARWNPSQLKFVPPSHAIEPAARRFLVVEALWNFCSVVGPKANQGEWWGRLMAHTAIPESVTRYPLPHDTPTDWRPFLTSLRNALENFRHGRRPSPETLVALKRAILCDSKFHRRFRDRQWEPWRSDDKEYRRKTGEG